MAKGKSSAKSKGYRTYHAKKPFLSKKEWIILIVAAVVLIAGFVVAVTVNFDGALQIKDGVVQPRTENALIVNGGTAAHPRYYQVGQLLSLPDGWSMEPGNDINVNTPSYTLLPPETSGVETVSVTVSGQEYQALAKAMAAYLTSASTDAAEISASELTESSIHGRPACTFTYEYAYQIEQDDDEGVDQGEDNAQISRYARKLNAYVQIPKNRTLLIYVVAEADDAEALPSEEEMRACLDTVAGIVAVEEK